MSASGGLGQSILEVAWAHREELANYCSGVRKQHMLTGNEVWVAGALTYGINLSNLYKDFSPQMRRRDYGKSLPHILKTAYQFYHNLITFFIIFPLNILKSSKVRFGTFIFPIYLLYVTPKIYGLKLFCEIAANVLQMTNKKLTTCMISQKFKPKL